MDKLKLQLVTDEGKYRGQWELLEPYKRTWRGRELRVPKGFVTDGPSIPERLRSIVPVRGMMWPAAVLHDFVYAVEPAGWTRAEADRMFMDILGEDGSYWITRALMYGAVRAGGFYLWGDRYEV